MSGVKVMNNYFSTNSPPIMKTPLCWSLRPEAVSVFIARRLHTSNPSLSLHSLSCAVFYTERWKMRIHTATCTSVSGYYSRKAAPSASLIGFMWWGFHSSSGWLSAGERTWAACCFCLSRCVVFEPSVLCRGPCFQGCLHGTTIYDTFNS